jgi:hypothetical protein
MLSQAFSRLQTNRLLAQCVCSLNALSVRDVHHHMERDNMRRFLGIERSNPQKANRNTHQHEKKWRKVGRLFKILIIFI